MKKCNSLRKSATKPEQLGSRSFPHPLCRYIHCEPDAATEHRRCYSCVGLQKPDGYAYVGSKMTSVLGLGRFEASAGALGPSVSSKAFFWALQVFFGSAAAAGRFKVPIQEPSKFATDYLHSCIYTHAHIHAKIYAYICT